MSNTNPFAVLPAEIANHVCSLLEQSEVSRLSRTNKSVYQLIRPILYRHPVLTFFTSLVLFSRTISKATYMGKLDHQWSTQECLDQTKTLCLVLDAAKDAARNNGQPATTVLISKTIQAVVRRCPNLAITLNFIRSHCSFTPISALENETFPRVTKLVLYVGVHEPDDTHPEQHSDEHGNHQRKKCSSDAKFWRPFVGGMSFPDCVNLEIRHYWAAAPPKDANLDLEKNYSIYEVEYGSASVYESSLRQSLPSRFGNRSSKGRASAATVSRMQIGSTYGLKKFESIVLECPPELDSSLLMQLLGNPDSVASNLTNLELRFCNLDTDTIAKLLYHSPPNLKRLVLLCWDSGNSAHRWRHSDPDHERPHLCPLVRQFSKNLVHLEFAASRVCRELFFDDSEIQRLERNGIKTDIADDSEKLDPHAIRETIDACRRQKRTTYRNNRIKEAIKIAKNEADSETTSSSLFGGNIATNQSAAKAQRETEAILDEEEEDRTRLIQSSKVPWFRRIIAWRGLCDRTNAWAELQLAADMEEKGIEWVMANKRLQVASQHSNGKLSVDIDLSQAFEETYDFTPRAVTRSVAMNDTADSDSEV